MNSADQNKVIQELVQTEKTYNASLALLDAALNQDALVENNPVLLTFRELVGPLKALSDQFLNNVNTAIESAVNDSTINKQRAQLAKAFFEVYPRYSENYTQYAQKESENRGHFQAIKQYVHENNSNNLDLAALLIQPIQRGPRYAMLISAVISYNEKLPEGDIGKLPVEKIEELQKLAALVQNKLTASNRQTPEMATGYQFGDITRASIRGFSRLFSQSPAVVNPPSPKQEEEADDLSEEFTII